MNHAAILYYANTNKEDFPLVLVMGREPNLGGGYNIGHTAGPYDFDAFPRCQFWNQAYGVLASLNNIRGWQLKTACRKRHASPILIGNASCRCIDSHDGGKEEVRAAVEMDAIRAQLDYIFEHPLMARVAAVILSGWDQPALHRSIEYATVVLKRKKVPVIAGCPYMAPRNRRAVDQAALASPHCGRVRETVGRFLSEADAR